MSKIIPDKFYIGIMTVKGKEHDGRHEKLTDEETFYRCQRILKGGSRGDSISKNQISEYFPLRHFILCGFCGRPLTASFSKGKGGGKFPYYHCYNKNCPTKKSIAKKKLEDDFFDYLEEVIPKEQFLDTFKAVILDVWQKQYKEVNQSRGDKLKRIEGLKNEKDRLIEMKKKELLPDDDFKEAFEKVRTEIANKQSDLDETNLQEFDLDEAVTYVFNFIKTIPEFWKAESTSYVEKIKLQSLIFPEKTIYDYKTFRTPKFSLIFANKKDLAYAKSSLVSHSGLESHL